LLKLFRVCRPLGALNVKHLQSVGLVTSHFKCMALIVMTAIAAIGLPPVDVVAQNISLSPTDGGQHSVPPIDLFVYADQSKSVFKGLVGQRPADKLVGMIRTTLNSSIDTSSGRKVLDRDGRLTIYGFADVRIDDEAAHSCGDDTQPIAQNVSASDKEAIAQALEIYSSTPDNRKATNFACLLDHISKNAAIRETTASGRQAMVLIASDFLHDPFDLALVDNSPGIRARLSAGNITPESGICQLLELYKKGAMPENIREPTGGLRRLVRSDDRFPPVFAFLELKLTDRDFSSSDNRYARCAIETTGSKLLSKLLAEELQAERFDFDDLDETSFARQFSTLLLARAAPRLFFSRAEISPIGTIGAELRATLANPGRLPVGTVAVQARQGEGPWVRAASIAIAVAPQEKATLGPTRLEMPNFDPALRTEVRALYRFQELDAVLTSREYSAVTDNATAINIKIAPLSLINATTFSSEAEISSNLAEASQIIRASIGMSPTNSRSVSIDNVGLINLSRDEQSATLPFSISSEEVSRSNVSLFVDVALQGGRGGVLSVKRELPRPREEDLPKPIETERFTLAFESYADPVAEIALNLGNPNPFEVEVRSCVFSINGQSRLVPLTERKTLSPGAKKVPVAVVNATLGDELLNAYSLSLAPTARCDGEQVPVATTSAAMETLAPDNPPGFSCASPERPDLFHWTMNGPNGLTLTLHFDIDTGLEGLAPKIGAYSIVGLAGQYEVPAGDVVAEKLNGGTRQRYSIQVPFHTEPRRSHKFERRDLLRFKFYDQRGAEICPSTITVPAHAFGEPKDFLVDAKSWRTVGRPGEDYSLIFDIYHQSEFSMNRLDTIELVEPASTVAGQVLEFQFLGAEDVVLEAADHYVAPGLSNKRSVIVSLTNAGLDNKRLDQYALMLLSASHHESRRPEPIRIAGAMLTSRIQIREPQWRTNRAQLLFTASSRFAALLDRIVLSQTREIESEEQYFVLRPAEDIGLRADESRDVAVDLPGDLTQQSETILLSDELYLCTLRPTDRIEDCLSWTRMPPLPQADSQIQENAGGYDPTTAKLTYAIRNPSPYPDRLEALIATDPNGNRRTLFLSPDRDQEFLPAISTIDGEASISDPKDQEFLLAAFRPGIGISTGRGPEVSAPVVYTIAPPTATLANERFEHVDDVAAWIQEGISGFIAFAVGDPPPVAIVDPPFYSANVVVERPQGGFEGLELRATVLGPDRQPIGAMTSAVSIDEITRDGETQTGLERRTYQLGITASDRLFDSTLYVRLDVTREGAGDPLNMAPSIFEIDGDTTFSIWDTGFYFFILFSMIVVVVMFGAKFNNSVFVNWLSYEGYKKYLIGGLLVIFSFIFVIAVNKTGNVFLSSIVDFGLIFVPSIVPTTAILFLFSSGSKKFRLKNDYVDIASVLMARHKRLSVGSAVVFIVLLGMAFYWSPSFSTEDACGLPASALRIIQGGAC